MSVERDHVQEIREEENDFYSDEDLFSIVSWGADLSFRELINQYEDGELLKPELQRQYVWDKVEASRFIDSILLGLPVPSIFLAKTPDEHLLIVDGYQRIMTVYDYVNGIFSRDGKVFRLSRSEKITPRWAGKAYKELTEAEQRKIRNTTIHAIVFVQQRPSGSNTSMYQIFERINTSGRTLVAQEIRNCVYQGDLNSLLFELNSVAEWRQLFGSGEADGRMRDMEFILRFLALRSPEFEKETRERISLKKFLNVFMGERVSMEPDAREGLRQAFIGTVQFLFATFGESAFHNLSPTNPDKLVSRFSPTIFDSLMIAADRALQEGQSSLPDDPEAERRDLLRDVQYQEAISVETMRTENIRLRIAKAAELFS